MLKATIKKTVLLIQAILLIAISGAGKSAQTSYTTEQPLQHSQPTNDTAVHQLKAVDSLQALATPKIVLNKQAGSFAKDYVKKNKITLKAVEKRSTPYFKMIDSVFTQYDIPIELKYLAVIESKLKPTAKSHCGAVGLWQFMPSTAKTVGLKVSSKYDERKYSYKSTIAAAKHLKKLYAEFGDWLLVIAAYNAGSGNVYKAIKRSGSKDFWKLQYHLPKETRLHVKRFIGTHHYFEEEASLVVLTRAETAAMKMHSDDIVEK
jgi:membrane-bound lytic murein transglycosylase D